MMSARYTGEEEVKLLGLTWPHEPGLRTIVIAGSRRELCSAFLYESLASRFSNDESTKRFIKQAFYKRLVNFSKVSRQNMHRKDSKHHKIHCQIYIVMVANNF